MVKRGRSGRYIKKGRNGGSETVGQILRKRRAFRPGYDRVSGYYGRYAPQGGGELKFHDVDLDDAVVANGGTITATINIIPQGVTEITRVGRKCTIKRIGWRYTVNLPESDAQATPASADTVRVILYMDKQANGATAAVTNILESADFQSFNNLANSMRFRVLMDRTHSMSYSGMASDGAGVVSQANTFNTFTFFKKCNIPLEFNAATGAIGEIRSNNLEVLLISSSGTASFASKFRLRFSDN